MGYYLFTHFEPVFADTVRAPRRLDDGRVDHRDLGFVQNVIEGQVIAEFREFVRDPREVTDGHFAEPHHRLVLATENYPLGPNTSRRGSQIIATASGHVTLADGRLAVQTLLHLKQDIDYNTGNVNFVGQLVIDGAVRPGFSVRGRNVLIRGTVDGALVSATEHIKIEFGVKGHGSSLLEAGTSISAAFSEQAFVVAGQRIVISGSALHNEMYASDSVGVGGKLVGGEVYSGREVYVTGQLGGGHATATALFMGADPTLFLKRAEFLQAHEDAHTAIALLDRGEAPLPGGGTRKVNEDEVLALREMQEKKREILGRKIAEVEARITATLRTEGVRVVARDAVAPGVEVYMGGDELFIDKPLGPSIIDFHEGHIRVQDLSAQNKKSA